jgi:hypothetical protein
MRTKIAPRARKEGLLTEELSNEVLVYDLERHKAHCLNPSAALIWKHCDGRTSITEIVQLLEKSLGTSVDEDVVWCALDQLEKDYLLEEQVAWPTGMERISRRTLIRRVGMAAILLPLVTTISAPTAHASASCGMPCVAGNCPTGCTCCLDNVCRVTC